MFCARTPLETIIEEKEVRTEKFVNQICPERYCPQNGKLPD
jgi:hypothetical protein